MHIELRAHLPLQSQEIAVLYQPFLPIHTPSTSTLYNEGGLVFQTLYAAQQQEIGPSINILGEAEHSDTNTSSSPILTYLKYIPPSTKKQTPAIASCPLPVLGILLDLKMLSKFYKLIILRWFQLKIKIIVFQTPTVLLNKH